MTGYTPERALFVTQNYHPEPIGSGPYLTDMAEFLARRGTRVQVFTCQPYYPDGVVPEDYADGSHDREAVEGVGVERVPPYAPERRGALGRIATELVFLLRGLLALAAGRVRRENLVVSLCPSIFTVLLGVFATRRGGRHVAVVHDIQSGLASGLGMLGAAGWIVHLMRWTERVVLNRADVVLVLSEPMKAHLEEQGVTRPIDVLPIWVDTRHIAPMDSPRDAEAPVVLYSGNLGKKQALDQVVAMASRLRQRGNGIRILLRGAGGDAARLAERVQAEGIDNIEFAPLVPREKLAEGLADGDIHLVPQDGKIADFAVPSKVFAIMAAGRPFIAAAPPGSLLWDLREQSGACECVPAGDVEALTEAIERLAHDPERRLALGRNGRTFAVEKHDTRLLLEDFLSHLHPVHA